jgi:hypothetical protein
MGGMIELLSALLVVAGVTGLAVMSFGRRLAERQKLLAILACSACAPGIVLGLAVFQISTAPTLPPPNDGPAMLFVALLMYGALAIPISVATSAILLFRFPASK